MTQEAIEFWLSQIWNYGWPTIALGWICWAIYKAVRAVWEFCKPLFQSVVDKFNEMVNRQITFVETVETQTVKQTETLSVVAVANTHGHTETHKRLEKIDDRLDEHGHKIDQLSNRIGGN